MLLEQPQGLTRCTSLRNSKHPSSSNSPTIGNLDGPSRGPRRTIPRARRTGHTSASGPSKSRTNSRASRVTRVSLSRTRPPTMPSPPSSLKPLTIRARTWSFSMRSSFRVRATSFFPILQFAHSVRRWIGVRRSLHEAPARQQEAPCRRIRQLVPIHYHVRAR